MDKLKAFLATTTGKVVAVISLVVVFVGVAFAVNPQAVTQVTQGLMSNLNNVTGAPVTKADLRPSNIKFSSVEFKYNPPKVFSFFTLSGKSFKDQNKLSEVTIGLDLKQLGAEEVFSNTVSKIAVIVRGNQNESYITFKIPNAEAFVNVLYKNLLGAQTPEQIAQMRSLAAVQKIEKIVKGESWLGITKDGLKNMLNGINKKQVDIDTLTPKDIEKLTQYFEQAYEISETKPNVDLNGKKYTRLTIVLKRDGLIKALEELKNDKDLVNKLNLDSKLLDEYIDKIKSMKDDSIWNTPVLYIYGVKGNGFEVARVQIMLPLDKDTKAQMNKALAEFKDNSMSEQFSNDMKEWYEQAQKTGYLDLGSIDFYNYNKVQEVTKPNNVLPFEELMGDIQMMMGASGGMMPSNSTEKYEDVQEVPSMPPYVR